MQLHTQRPPSLILLEFSHLPFHLSLTEILQEDRTGVKSPIVQTRKDVQTVFTTRLEYWGQRQAQVPRSDSQTEVVQQPPATESLVCSLKCQLQGPQSYWIMIFESEYCFKQVTRVPLSICGSCPQLHNKMVTGFQTTESASRILDLDLSRAQS